MYNLFYSVQTIYDGNCSQPFFSTERAVGVVDVFSAKGKAGVVGFFLADSFVSALNISSLPLFSTGVQWHDI
jgi:hypothetical protein